MSAGCRAFVNVKHEDTVGWQPTAGCEREYLVLPDDPEGIPRLVGREEASDGNGDNSAAKIIGIASYVSASSTPACPLAFARAVFLAQHAAPCVDMSTTRRRVGFVQVFDVPGKCPRPFRDSETFLLWFHECRS